MYMFYFRNGGHGLSESIYYAKYEHIWSYPTSSHEIRPTTAAWMECSRSEVEDDRTTMENQFCDVNSTAYFQIIFICGEFK